MPVDTLTHHGYSGYPRWWWQNDDALLKVQTEDMARIFWTIVRGSRESYTASVAACRPCTRMDPKRNDLLAKLPSRSAVSCFLACARNERATAAIHFRVWINSSKNVGGHFPTELRRYSVYGLSYFLPPRIHANNVVINNGDSRHTDRTAISS
jgi:hypothetical protein